MQTLWPIQTRFCLCISNLTFFSREGTRSGLWLFEIEVEVFSQYFQGDKACSKFLQIELVSLLNYIAKVINITLVVIRICFTKSEQIKTVFLFTLSVHFAWLLHLLSILSHGSYLMVLRKDCYYLLILANVLFQYYHPFLHSQQTLVDIIKHYLSDVGSYGALLLISHIFQCFQRIHLQEC